MEDEKRDLLKYFKLVNQCKLCKRLYGMDVEEKEIESKDTCPICAYKGKDKWRYAHAARRKVNQA